MTDQLADGTDGQETADLAREWALRAVLEIIEESGRRMVPRPVFRDLPDLDVTASGTDPMAGLQAAMKLRFAARQLALDYTRRARRAGHSWEEIGVALARHYPPRWSRPALGGETWTLLYASWPTEALLPSPDLRRV